LLAASLVLASAVALAQAAPETAQSGEVEELIVTGTAAKDRTVLDSPVPIDLLSAEDLARTGAVSDELGQALAAVAPSFNFPRQSNSGTSDHVRAGQLRGLSPDQLLVLVNGKRRHGSAVVNSETKIGRGTAAVDFNTIPLSAVERVEILRDGAGAQYGSDAVAGVINVLFDEDPDRTDIEASFGAHVTHHEPTDRDIRDGETFTLNASTGFALPGEGFLRIGGEFEDRNKTNRAGFDLVPFFEDPANAYLAGRRSYTMGDPNSRAYGLWFNGEALFGEVSFYGFGTFSNRDTRGGGAFFRYPISDDNVLAIYPDGYRPHTRADDLDFSFTFGAEYDVEAFTLDTSVSYGRDELDFGVSNSLNPSFGLASPTKFHSGEYVNDQLGVNVDATREIAVAAFDGPLTLLLGVGYRRETYETTRGDLASYEAGPFAGCPVLPCSIGAQAGPGLTPLDEVELDRNVVSLYVDTAAEVVEDVLVDLAVRYEHYSDFGSEVTGKLSAAWTLADALTLRGAVSNSFRAPGVQQVGYSDTSTTFGPASSLVRVRTVRPNTDIGRAVGARKLDAEKSFNASLGATYSIGAFDASVDLFHVQIDDRITLSEQFSGPGIAGIVNPLPGGAGIEGVRYFANAVDTKTQGVDVVLAYAQELLGGDLGLDLSFSYADTEIERYAPTPAVIAGLGFRLVGSEETNTLETAAPDSKLVLTGDWSNEDLTLLARFTRHGSTKRVFAFDPAARQRYGPELQLDLEASYRFLERFTVALGAVNVTDNYPDESGFLINFFDNFPYDVLSPIGVNGRYVYTRLSVSF
jgi:iron complex outermembrane receptor protein